MSTGVRRAVSGHRRAAGHESGSRAESGTPVPAARGGCHLDSKTFRTHFNAALKSVGREGVRVHDLRHFAGTQTARVGGSLADTMERLGHSTHGASLIYQHAVTGRDAQIAEALSRLAEEPADE